MSRIRISYKISLLFTIVILIIFFINSFFLMSSLYNDLIDKELEGLVNRIHGHRESLEYNYNKRTVNQALVSEYYSGNLLIFTDEKKQIIASSSEISSEIELLKESFINLAWTDPAWLPINGHTEKYLLTDNYLAISTPVVLNSGQVAYIYMLAEISQIKDAANNLQMQFIFVGFLSTIIFALAIFVLVNLVSRPVRYMSLATKEMSQGNYNVILDYDANDELGELSNSIYILSTKLQRLNRERNNFLASIAHELRTPLSYLKGYANILYTKELDVDDKNRYLAIINEEATRLSVLVDNLFDLAQLEQHQLLIEPQNVNLKALIKSSISAFDLALKDKGKDIVLNMEQELVAFIDPIRFEQVFFNLLDNAIKYGLDNGVIEVNAYKEDKTNSLVIDIINSSEVINQDELDMIWDKFYRLEESRSRKFGGSGLGLAIVKEIVDLHAGRISMSYFDGKVTVRIELLTT